MSDLQCAATVIVARHADASYESAGLTDAGGSLTLPGRDQAHRLGEELADRRVAAVWCSSHSRAVQTAEIVAARVGCAVTVREGLREFAVGDFAGRSYRLELFTPSFDAWIGGDLDLRLPGGETGREVLDRMSAVLEEVVDLHRGETVLVVSHGGAMSLALPLLAANLRPDHARDRDVDNCASVEMLCDGAGWVCRSWAGKPL